RWRKYARTQMKNVTITLNEGAVRWAKVEAAKAGKSLSRWMGERIERERALAEDRDAGNTPQTLEYFLTGPGYPGVAANLPTRDELYDRPALRRHERTDLQPRSARTGKKAQS
ncbi:MAG: hypothetical protein ABI399_07295, partial [Bauldia sp.]